MERLLEPRQLLFPASWMRHGGHVHGGLEGRAHRKDLRPARDRHLDLVSGTHRPHDRSDLLAGVDRRPFDREDAVPFLDPDGLRRALWNHALDEYPEAVREDSAPHLDPEERAADAPVLFEIVRDPL